MEELIYYNARGLNLKYPIIFIYSVWALIGSFSAYAATSPDITKHTITPTTAELPWAALVYWGRTTNNTLLQVLEFNPGGFMDETLYSAELSYRLLPTNPVRHFVQRFLFAHSFELNANFTYRDDPVKAVYEFDPYFSVRWEKFPWDKYLLNSFAIGEGISYASRIPTVEIDTTDTGDTKKLLNYLMFEVTFALPSQPQWQLVGRIHHRSGVFGLYGAENSGSSAVGLGIRYKF